jgi:predicted ATPase
MIALSSEQGFAFWVAWGTNLRGWAIAEQGQGEEGIVQMRQGLAAYRATGAEIGRPRFLALLAEVYGKVDQTEDGLRVLAEALALVDKTGERVSEAELYRLKGELLLTQEGYRLQAVGLREKAEEAEECFLKAIEVARRQQAKSLELRAVMSLVRLRQQQATQYASRNMQHEARNILDAARNTLSEIYGWFTEGFDTKDLQEAKALLEALQSESSESGSSESKIV